NLVACGLIPRGVAFPDPPIFSRPPSSKKKSRRTELGASSSRKQKRKAQATPPRSEPSSPEAVSPPASQPAPQEEGNHTTLTFTFTISSLTNIFCTEMVIGSGL
ncbi:hypothetical protein PanWU01x14_069510, partial [Parasponia andersonii]